MIRIRSVRPVVLSSLLAALFAAPLAHAAQPQMFLATIDGKSQQVAGKTVTVPGVDMLAMIAVDGKGATVLQQMPLPNSAMGPAQSVAIAPDGTLALVTARTKRDPGDAGRTVPDDLVSVLDLSVKPARLIATLHAGMGAGGLSISPDGKLALVTGNADGTVTVLGIAGRKVGELARLTLGPKTEPVMAVFTVDGKHALVTRNGDNRISWLDVNGSDVKVSPRAILAGLRPNAIDVGARGDYAVEADIGGHSGDSNTVSLIDLRQAPPRVVDTISVGETPEDIAFSPDGLHIGVVVQNGSNDLPGTPFYHAHGLFKLLKVEQGKLVAVSAVPIGGWSQGGVFSANGRTVLVENGIEKNMQVLAVDGDTVRDTGRILQFDAAPGGLRAFQQR